MLHSPIFNHPRVRDDKKSVRKIREKPCCIRSYYGRWEIQRIQGETELTSGFNFAYRRENCMKLFLSEYSRLLMKIIKRLKCFKSCKEVEIIVLNDHCQAFFFSLKKGTLSKPDSWIVRTFTRLYVLAADSSKLPTSSKRHAYWLIKLHEFLSSK